jgi:hypothetical protein
MRTPVALSVLSLAACGRLGFRDVPADAPVVEVAPDAPSLLTCGAPERLALAGATSIAAVATAAGYLVVSIDAAGNVRARTAAVRGGALVTAADAPIASDASGTVSAIAAADGALIVLPYGRPTATGTAVLALDASLGVVGTPARFDGWIAGPGAVARAASGELTIAVTLPSGEVDVAHVGATGELVGAAAPAVSKTEAATLPTVVAGPAGVTLAWSANAASPNQVRAGRIDDLVNGATATPISTGPFDAFVPRVAYAAASDSYLFAWMEKASGGDVIGFALRDGKLGARAAVSFTPPGNRPAVVAGDHDFLAVWQDDAAASGLAAARITADGAIMPMTIPGAGGKALAWDVVVRDGQPAVAWLENTGAATPPTLWLDPVCR